MQRNTFTCSKCHKNYPIQSKVMHELFFFFSSNVPQHQISLLYHSQPQIDINAHIPYQPQYIPQAQKCPKCGIEFPQNEMLDHLLVHQLDEEKNNPENAQQEQKEAPSNNSEPNYDDEDDNNNGSQMNNVLSSLHNYVSHMADLQNNIRALLEQINQPAQHPVPDTIVNELPEITIDSVDKLDGDKKDCTICLNSFKHGDKALILPCIHIFHTDCIKNWFKTQNTCPNCKFKMDANSLNN